MATDRPIFIFGCPRSGTTLLRLMLRTHPRIAIPPETRFLLGAYEHRSAYGDLRRSANRRALAEWIAAGAGTRFSELGLNPHDVVAEIIAGPPTLGSSLGIALRAYARRVGKPRWGDSRPGYVQHIAALLRLFPDAQFVHVVRDGRDCVASLKRTPWWRMGTYHAIATWTQAIDAGRVAAHRLPLGSYTEVRLERLVEEPEDELRRLCEFLGEEYATEMTRPDELSTPTWRRRSTASGEPFGPASIGEWPQILERWEIELCEAVMAERLTMYGYVPSAAAWPPVHRLTRYATITAHRRLAARKRTILDRRIRAGEPQPVASRLGSPTDAAPV